MHLGTRTAQAARLLQFLKQYEADTIYLVGDIIDFWKVRRGPHWAQSHNDVLQKLMRRVRKGTRLVYIPGNHDEGLRDYIGLQFGGMEIHRDTLHTTADGRRYLVLHGDKYDGIVRFAPWLARLGDRAYEVSMTINGIVNRARRLVRLPYWSLSAYLEFKVKKAVEFISHFEDAVVREARQRGAQGVICGHIHTPDNRMIDDIHYLNDGDWVESCTALIEHFDGRFEIIE